MGIKNIHLVLIIVSIALAVGFGTWAMGHDSSMWGYTSFIIAVGLLVYGVNFIKKMKVL